MEEFTWCRLSPHHFSSVMERALYRDGQPENVLFTRKVRKSSLSLSRAMCRGEEVRCMPSCT